MRGRLNIELVNVDPVRVLSAVTMSLLLQSCSASPMPDAGQPVELDAGRRADAGPADAGEPDAGEPDAGERDAGERDAGLADAGVPDAGLVCPQPAPNSAEAMLPWGEVLQLRMASDFISWFVVPPPMGNFHSVVLTQGQQPSTPAGVVTEFYVSRCRGVIDPNGVPQCYFRSTFVNNNTITIYRSAVNGWTDQATLGAQGCWAPESEGPWYANVRWTYASCPFASCGFSMQWTSGGW